MTAFQYMGVEGVVEHPGEAEILGGRILFSKSLEADSALAILPFTQMKLVRAFVDAEEKAILDGDGDGTQIGAAVTRDPGKVRSFVVRPGQRLVSGVDAVVAANYPVKRCHPAHVDDLVAAARFVAANAARFGGDPARVALVGHSAGAHMAMMAVLRAASERVFVPLTVGGGVSIVDMSRAPISAM